MSLGAQPNIEWQKCLGGTSYEDASELVETADGIEKSFPNRKRISSG